MHGLCLQGGEGDGQRGQLRKVNAAVVLSGRGGGGTDRPADERKCRGLASVEGRGRDREAS